jgi:SAM-dependent methyltransferase
MAWFNNLFCSFKGEGTGAVRHLFSHHILKPERTPLENNPWGTPRSSGSFSTLFERRLLAARSYAERPFEIRATRQGNREVGAKVFGINHPIQPRLAAKPSEFLRGQAQAYVFCGDSARLPLPDASVDLVITDPPYFDMVNYSELADFFYVWLRLGLEHTDLSFRPSTTRNDREVQAACAEQFGRMLGDVFTDCVRVLKPGGLVVFTFHHPRLEAWEALGSALRTAGLGVMATHPIKAELSVATPKSQAKEPINLDLVIVCTPQPAPPTATTPEQFLELSRQGARATVLRFNAGGINLSKGDLRVILLGWYLKAPWALAAPGEDSGRWFLERLQGEIEALHRSQRLTVPAERKRALLTQRTFWDAAEATGA